MNGRFDSRGLYEELLAAGIARGAVAGTRSGTRTDQDGTEDATQIVDWTPGHPTAAERAVAVAVLAAHDPGRRTREQAARRARIEILEAKGAAMTDAELRELQLLSIELRRNGTP